MAGIRDIYEMLLSETVLVLNISREKLYVYIKIKTATNNELIIYNLKFTKGNLWEDIILASPHFSKHNNSGDQLLKYPCIAKSTEKNYFYEVHTHYVPYLWKEEQKKKITLLVIHNRESICSGTGVWESFFLFIFRNFFMDFITWILDLTIASGAHIYPRATIMSCRNNFKFLVILRKLRITHCVIDFMVNYSKLLEIHYFIVFLCKIDPGKSLHKFDVERSVFAKAIMENIGFVMNEYGICNVAIKCSSMSLCHLSNL